MRDLKPNEKFIKEYDTFILIEVACPDNRKYRTTISKWTQRDFGYLVPKYDIEARLDKRVTGGMYV